MEHAGTRVQEFLGDPVSAVLPVDVAVPGCPPSPTRILQGILTAVTVAAGR